MNKFTIRRQYGYYDIVKITKETPRMIYGSIGGVGTHVKPSDCVGRFDDEATTKAAIENVERIYTEHEHLIRKARVAVANAENARDREVSVYLKRVSQADET